MNNLNVMAPINALGYGVASINIILRLKEIFNVSLFPIGMNPEAQALFGKEINASSMFDPDAPCLKIWHEFDMAVRAGRGDLIAFPFFELNEFDERKKHHLSQCDKVIASCKWAADVIEDQAKDCNVSVAPLGVNRDIFYHHSERIGSQKPNKDKFVVFNCGKWEVRKGHDIVREVFQNAFPNETDVELWMMCQNPIAPPEYNQKWNDFYREDHRCRLLERCNTHQELSDIMRSTDCGFFPSRAEGWNLELLEMLSCGKHVVTTDYSAHTEFCTEENSYKFKPKSLEKAYDGMYFPEQGLGQWASLDGIKEEFSQSLRELYEKWKSGDDMKNTSGIETAKQFSWDACAEKIGEIVDVS